MRSDVGIRNRSGIDLAADHECGTLDLKSFLLIPMNKFRKRLSGNASHYLFTFIQLC
jgi:hypothetical protein